MTQVSDDQANGNQQSGAPVGPQQGWQPSSGRVPAMPPPNWQKPQQPAGMMPYPYPGPPYPYPVPQARPQTNGTSVFAFIMALLWLGGIGSILGLIFGIVGAKECERTGEAGSGLATAAAVLGLLGTIAAFFMIVV